MTWYTFCPQQKPCSVELTENAKHENAKQFRRVKNAANVATETQETVCRVIDFVNTPWQTWGVHIHL